MSPDRKPARAVQVTRGRVRLEGLTVRFGARAAVVHVDLSIEPGEFVCLLGPSGCGKSTVLNAVAGFVTPAAGRVVVDDAVVTGPGADRGMVFQQYSLFPWKTVLENVAFGPRMQGLSRRDARIKAAEYIEFVGLGGHAGSYPSTLSGGMLGMHLGSSVFRVIAGYCAAAVIGVLLGLAIGRSRRAEDALLPPLELLRPIPAVAWISLAILMFPSAEMSMIFITFTGAIFPILLATVHGVEGVDHRLVASAQSLGATWRAIFTEVLVPAALPSIVTGLTIGMGTSWFCLVTAEMISGQFGIGYFTWESYTLQNYADIVLGMVVIGLFGMASSLMAAIQRRRRADMTRMRCFSGRGP